MERSLGGQGRCQGFRASSRRQFIHGAMLGVMSTVLSDRVLAHSATTLPAEHHNGPWRTCYLGTTFSPLQCYYMDLDFKWAFRRICTLGLDRIRLGAYWNVIEKQPGQYDFSELDWLLERCADHGIDAIVSVGMKVPRWPEFHFPTWVDKFGETGAGEVALDQRSPKIAAKALGFLEKVVTHCRNAPALKYWQVENEPFTQLEITGGRFLSYFFVQQEITLLTQLKLSSQRILLTNALHLPTPRDEDHIAFWESLRLADAVGLNVYTKVPAGHSGAYLEPTTAFWQTLGQWRQTLHHYDREAWVAEAQAEPWEPRQLVAMSRFDYPSATPRRMRTLVHALRGLGYTSILLWGCEYWYWQKQNRRNQWWWEVERLLEEVRSSDWTVPWEAHGTFIP